MTDRDALLADMADLVIRTRDAVGPGRPVLIGIAGPPGAGKSTLAEDLLARLRLHDIDAALVPMDGFHLSNRILAHQGSSASKGAPETFDVSGLEHLLIRILQRENAVYAPAYSRELHEAIAASVLVTPSTEVVLVEGNYLLVDDQIWKPLRELLDLGFYLDVDWHVCRDRLVQRQVAGGRTPEEAEAWVDRSDRRNHDFVASASDREGVVTIREGRIAPARA